MATPKQPTARRRAARPGILAALRDRRPAPSGRHAAARRPMTGQEAVDQRADLVADFPGPDSPVPVDARVAHAMTVFGLGGGR